MTTPGQPPERMAARSLDPHLHRYAARAVGMTASELADTARGLLNRWVYTQTLQ